jgi:hypothetical protein
VLADKMFGRQFWEVVKIGGLVVVAVLLLMGLMGGFSVMLGIFNFFKLFLPVTLAMVFVKFSGNLKRRLPRFIVFGLISFSVMILYRFFANPEFWIDWITWFYELEIVLSLLLAYSIYKKKYHYLFLGLLPLSFALIIGSKLRFQPPKNLDSISTLEKIVKKDERVFLSGSSVFWASDILQLRGGRDEVIKNKDWLDASYIFRESKDEELVTKNLRLLNIKYVLVHTKDSKEYYHDFKNEEVWDKIGILIYDNSGDKLYRID